MAAHMSTEMSALELRLASLRARVAGLLGVDWGRRSPEALPSELDAERIGGPGSGLFDRVPRMLRSPEDVVAWEAAKAEHASIKQAAARLKAAG